MGVERHTRVKGNKLKAQTRVRPILKAKRRNKLFPTKPAAVGPARLQFHWAAAISELEWAVYREAIRVIRDAGVRFLLGGGFALATFTGRWRDTKDIDFYIHRDDREAVVAALTKAGFADYYDQRAYDRKWIHRTVKAGVIVDIIWAMANQRSQVDERWFEHAGSVTMREETVQVVPMEEFMWCKLYIMQRDHCDWTDLFNLLYANGARMDWARLIKRVEADVPLLKGLLTVYGWLCPAAALRLPKWLWARLDLSRPKPAREMPKRDRIRLLDTRYWFAALKSAGEKLEV